MPAAMFVVPDIAEADYDEASAMKLRKEDRDWLSAEIVGTVKAEVSSATSHLTPKGWRRAAYLLREWSILGTILSVIVALFGLTLSAAYVATARVAKQAAFESDTTNKLGDIGRRLDRMDATLAALQIGALADRPVTETSALETKRVIAEAKTASIKIPAPVVREAGERFVSSSKLVPAAWDTAVSFVNYASFRNADVIVVPPYSATRPTTHYNIWFPAGSTAPLLATAGTSPKATAAAFNHLGKDPDEDSPVGATIIVARGGSVTLDGMHIKSMIFVGVHVYYSGGPLKLENAQFSNCVFELPHNRNAEGFVLANLKASSLVNFAATS